jgi:hypothetical protein
MTRWPDLVGKSEALAFGMNKTVSNTERLGEEEDGGQGIATRTCFRFQNEFSYNVHDSIAHSSPEYILELALPHWAVYHGVGLVLPDGPALLRSDGITWCFRISSSNIPPVFRAGMPHAGALGKR